MRHGGMKVFGNIREARQVHINGKRPDGCQQAQGKDQNRFGAGRYQEV